jgi:16S rRNA (guanine527-N7)-methyltransferase
MEENITKTLQSACNPTQWKQLLQFVELLTEYNQQVNLISRKDIDHVWDHHVAPSFLFTILHRIQPGERILDIGSGGGFPGIINAILFPDTEFLLVDSTRKKIHALTEIIQKLSLPNVTAQWARIESLATDAQFKKRFHRTTSRAVAPLSQLVEWSIPLLLPSGSIEALKGGDIQAEVETMLNNYSTHIKEHHLFYSPASFQLNEKLRSAVLVSIILTPNATS